MLKMPVFDVPGVRERVRARMHGCVCVRACARVRGGSGDVYPFALMYFPAVHVDSLTQHRVVLLNQPQD